MSARKLTLPALFALLSGCSTGPDLPVLAETARPQVTARAPVVVFLPGTLAATLENVETGERVWGRQDALSLDPRTPDGLRQLSLPISPPPAGETAAIDTIRPVDALRRAGRTILGMRVSIPIYEDALDGLGRAGLRETAPGAIPASGPSLTAFPYDWRRSIVDGAQALGKALEARGEGAEKVVLVGHSMGGTVALHYLMYGTAPLNAGGGVPEITWAGAKQVKRAVLVGPPLRGSTIAIRNTVNGNHIAGPLVPTFPTTMLATHPSSFELMPRPTEGALQEADGTVRADGGFDPALWERRGWGLANPLEADKRRWLAGGEDDPDGRGLARQAALLDWAQVFHRAADRRIDPPEGLDIHVIAGTGEATLKTVRMIDDHEVAEVLQSDGDGTVLLSSASAGFEDSGAHPRKTLSIIEAEHSRMVSDPTAFSLILDAISAE